MFNNKYGLNLIIKCFNHLYARYRIKFWCTMANKADHAVLALPHNLAGKIYVKQTGVL